MITQGKSHIRWNPETRRFTGILGASSRRYWGSVTCARVLNDELFYAVPPVKRGTKIMTEGLGV